MAYSNDLHHSLSFPQQRTRKYLIVRHMLHILSASAQTGNFASHQTSRHTAGDVINHMVPHTGLMEIHLFGYSVCHVGWVGLSSLNMCQVLTSTF